MQGATNKSGSVGGAAKVSIHAPYAGSDETYCGESAVVCKFQSTPPMQGATKRKEST